MSWPEKYRQHPARVRQEENEGKEGQARRNKNGERERREQPPLSENRLPRPSRRKHSPCSEFKAAKHYDWSASVGVWATAMPLASRKASRRQPKRQPVGIGRGSGTRQAEHCDSIPAHFWVSSGGGGGGWLFSAPKRGDFLVEY